MYTLPRKRRFRWLARGGTGLHRCIVCGSDRVCPIDWVTDGPDHWLITLHCPECDVWRDVRATNAEAKAFDLVLDSQLAAIARALAQLDQEQMRAEADLLAAALKRDLIDAADFAEH